MELSYEQHAELLKLANYLAKVKISASQKGIEINSLVEEPKNNNFISFVGGRGKKDSQLEKKSTMTLEIEKI